MTYVCPRCRELFDASHSYCPDCDAELLEAVLCPICETKHTTEDELTCPDCEKYTRFAQNVYHACENLFYTLIKAYAGTNERALLYLRELYEEGLL